MLAIIGAYFCVLSLSNRGQSLNLIMVTNVEKWYNIAKENVKK